MLQLIHCSSPLPLTLYMLTYFLCVATGMRSAEIPRDPQRHPGSRYQAVDNVVSAHCSRRHARNGLVTWWLPEAGNVGCSQADHCVIAP